MLPVTIVAAQTEPEPEISAGCAAVDGVVDAANPTFSFVLQAFVEGDSIVAAISGAGTEFALLESGSIVVGPVPFGESLEYIIPADGDYLFSVEVTASDATTEVTFSCEPAEVDDGGGIVIPEDGNVTLCHYPPGNPAAAHTITVGAPAASTHIGHGDTLGACPPGVNTRHDDFDTGTVIIVIPTTGEITLLGGCAGETCQPIISIFVTQITIVNSVIIVTDGGGQFVDEDDPGDVGQEIDTNPNDGFYIVIYYLHPDPADPTVGVFQINLYQNNTLINDSTLIFLGLDGSIVRWTTHQFWLEQADEAAEA